MTVALGIIHDYTMDSLFVRCLFQLLRDRDEQIAGAIFVGGGMGRLDIARNEVVKKFLPTSAEWLLTLDTDMAFLVEDFDNLLASASEEVPIVSGIYMVDERPPRAAAGNVAEGGHIKSIADWEDDKLLEVEYCGAGFMLVHRSVYEKLGDEPYRQDVVAPSGALVGDDYSFCWRAREAGFKVMVDPRVFVGHIKPKVLGYDTP